MKYNININQKALLEIAPDISLREAAVLVVLVDMCKAVSMKRQQIDGRTYTFVSLAHLMEEVPMLKLKKASYSVMLGKFEKWGFIERKIVKRRLWVSLRQLCDSIEYDGKKHMKGVYSGKQVVYQGKQVVYDTKRIIKPNHKNQITHVDVCDELTKKYKIPFPKKDLDTFGRDIVEKCLAETRKRADEGRVENEVAYYRALTKNHESVPEIECEGYIEGMGTDEVFLQDEEKVLKDIKGYKAALHTENKLDRAIDDRLSLIADMINEGSDHELISKEIESIESKTGVRSKVRFKLLKKEGLGFGKL